MSATVAKRQIDKMVLAFLRTSNDQDYAIRKVAEACELGFWTVENIRSGKTKRVFSDVRDAIRHAYLDVCEEQARRWRAELDAERAKGNVDADLEGLYREVEDLSSRIAERRKAIGGGR